jgi:predicted transcriptional regulator
MTKQTTIRIPDDLAEQIEVIAAVRNISINQLTLEALQIEISRVREDKKFMVALKEHTRKHKELLERLAK